MNKQEIAYHLDTLTSTCREFRVASEYMTQTHQWETLEEIPVVWSRCREVENKFNHSYQYLIEHDIIPIWDDESQQFIQYLSPQ
jgi:hypothetical protein